MHFQVENQAESLDPCGHVDRVDVVAARLDNCHQIVKTPIVIADEGASRRDAGSL